MKKISVIVLCVISVLIASGCVTSDHTSVSSTTTSQQGNGQSNVAQLSSETPYGFVAQSSDYSCLHMTGVSETDFSSGYLGKNIADTRRVTGTITNNCGKIMEFYVSVRWFDSNGIAAYYGIPKKGYFFRLKSGDSTEIQFDGIQSDPKYGYIEETNGWIYKVGIGNRLLNLD